MKKKKSKLKKRVFVSIESLRDLLKEMEEGAGEAVEEEEEEVENV